MGKIWRRVVFVLLMLLLCSGSSLSLFTNVGFLFEKRLQLLISLMAVCIVGVHTCSVITEFKKRERAFSILSLYSMI